jgi:hypothetical protein
VDLTEEERAQLVAFLATLDPTAPDPEQVADAQAQDAQAQTDALQGGPSE